MAHGCKHGSGIFGVPAVAVVLWASASGLIARRPVITQVRMVCTSISMISCASLKENVTCRGGLGISISILERIGKLGYIAITLDDPGHR